MLELLEADMFYRIETVRATMQWFQQPDPEICLKKRKFEKKISR